MRAVVGERHLRGREKTQITPFVPGLHVGAAATWELASQSIIKQLY